MERFMTLLSTTAFACAVGLSGAASAATTDAPLFDFKPPVTTTFTFSWESTPYANVFTFDPFNGDFNFDLTFESYTGTDNDQTGYFVDYDGSRLTTESSACDSAGGSFVGGCNLVNAASVPGETLFSNLTGGTYTFGIYDSATPVSGSVTFGLIKRDEVAPVPLPAAGFLLLGALGGIAALRRRKS